MQKAAAKHHIQMLQSIDSNMVQVGQEQVQLENLIPRADKAFYAIDQWKKSGRRVFLGKFLFKPCIADHFANLGVEIRNSDLGAAAESKDLLRLSREIRGAIVLLNSNDLHRQDKMELLRKLYRSCPRTLFIAWVWDNHHMVTHSAMIGLSVDVQYPAHYDNLHILNRFCPFGSDAQAGVTLRRTVRRSTSLALLTYGASQGRERTWRTPLPAACHAWTKAQARSFGECLASAARPVRLSGGFIYYPQFPHRNNIVRTIMKQKIGRDLRMYEQDYNYFLNQTPEERWNDWMSSKANLVVPTLSDLPIRVFDALLTGNVPLIPRNLAHAFASMDQATIRELPIIWFDYADLPDMASLVKKACNEFDSGGADGIWMRHRYALDNHMMEDRIQTILDDISALGSRCGS
jgi:hypothetical protein